MLNQFLLREAEAGENFLPVLVGDRIRILGTGIVDLCSRFRLGRMLEGG